MKHILLATTALVILSCSFSAHAGEDKSVVQQVKEKIEEIKRAAEKARQRPTTSRAHTGVRG
jgi:hypothetical protein